MIVCVMRFIQPSRRSNQTMEKINERLRILFALISQGITATISEPPKWSLFQSKHAIGKNKFSCLLFIWLLSIEFYLFNHPLGKSED